MIIDINKVICNIPPVDKKEVLRYSKAYRSSMQIDNILDDCIEECQNEIKYSMLYADYTLNFHENGINFNGNNIESLSLKKNLNGCNKIILIYASSGIYFDKAYHKYKDISPVKSLLISSLGSERVEALCDSFCDELRKEYKIKPRFSPGYGDLSIELQKIFFNELNINKLTGAVLNDKLFITPTKSVTAFIGIEE